MLYTFFITHLIYKARAFSIFIRVSALKETIAKATSEYEKEKLQERLAKMAGGVAVIKIGGASEIEVS